MERYRIAIDVKEIIKFNNLTIEDKDIYLMDYVLSEEYIIFNKKPKIGSILELKDIIELYREFYSVNDYSILIKSIYLKPCKISGYKYESYKTNDNNEEIYEEVMFVNFNI